MSTIDKPRFLDLHAPLSLKRLTFLLMIPSLCFQLFLACSNPTSYFGLDANDSSESPRLADHISFARYEDLEICHFERRCYAHCGLVPYELLNLEFKGWAELSDSAADSLKRNHHWSPLTDGEFEKYVLAEYLPEKPLLTVIKSEPDQAYRREALVVDETRGWNHVSFYIMAFKHE